MSMTSAIKRLAIRTGLYRPARWLRNCMRRELRDAMRADVDLFRSILPPGALSFDVGANIGVKSEALLRAGARVIAFEPNPEVTPELIARCRVHPDWTLVCAAVGSQSAVSILYARVAQGGMSSMEADWAEGIRASYHVPVITLDAAINHFGVPAYCKIDVEGWELEVFRGLSRPLPLLSFEFHLTESNIRRTTECLARLALLGPGSVNVTPAESTTFILEQWMALDDFLAWFPGDLERRLPGEPYGDIWVRVA